MKKQKKKEPRHYCRKCGSKRNESHMHVVGTGAFGKQSWECKIECSDAKYKHVTEHSFGTLEYVPAYKHHRLYRKFS